MSELPYFKFFPADFLADEKVAIMDLPARGLYITLLSYAWLNGSLPADLDVLSQVTHIKSSQVKRLWPKVVTCFRKDENGRLVNPRLEKERESARGKSAKARKAAEQRWSERNPDAMQTHTERNAMHSIADTEQSIAEQKQTPTPKVSLEGGTDFSAVIGRIADVYPNPSQFQVGIQRLTECSSAEIPRWMALFEDKAREWSAHWRETSNGRNVAAHGAPKFAEFVENYNLIYSKGPPVKAQKQTALDKIRAATGGGS